MKKKVNYFKKNMNNCIRINRKMNKTKGLIFISKTIYLCKNLCLFYQVLNNNQRISNLTMTTF